MREQASRSPQQVESNTVGTFLRQVRWGLANEGRPAREIRAMDNVLTRWGQIVVKEGLDEDIQIPLGTVADRRRASRDTVLSSGEERREMGGLVRARRQELGLSQRQLAERLGIPESSQSQISLMEKGLRPLPHNVVSVLEIDPENPDNRLAQLVRESRREPTPEEIAAMPFKDHFELTMKFMGMNQRMVAMEAGLSPTLISRLVNGGDPPSKGTWEKIRGVLPISEDLQQKMEAIWEQRSLQSRR